MKKKKLSPKQYARLRNEVLDRDNYSCICTGDHTKAPPHHIRYKSQGGGDVKENLATLSVYAHSTVHNGGVEQLEALLEEIKAYWGVKKLIDNFLRGVAVDRSRNKRW